MKLPSPHIISFINDHLNEQQRQAVLHKKGSLLIIAGAGSGKTRVITARIAYMIKELQIAPHSILALTFTNKAAKEMRERIDQFVGDDMQTHPFIGTFHSYCLRFLKTHHDLLETPLASILDQDDQHKLLQSLITRYGLSKKTTPKQISYQISSLKNQSLHPYEALHTHHNPMLYEIFKAYEHEKKMSRCLDFDDLLIETVQLFKKNPPLQEQYHGIIKHVLVDEYQDTNIVQHELLKQLSLNAKNKLAIDSLCAVGDEDQSIYSWRGATVTNMLNFTKDIPSTKIITIEQNYRSVQPILEIANQVITHNNHRNPKSLWSARKASDRVRIAACLSEYQEADFIAQFIKATQKGEHPLKETAILYRTHFQSRAIEEALVKYALPYTIIGGLEFYERKEIKDMLAYLRLLINPYDRVSFLRVINTPLRGIGDKAEEALFHHWQMHPFDSFDQVVQQCIEHSMFTGAKKTSLEAFITIFRELSATIPASLALQTLLERTNYYTYLKETYEKQEALDRIDNLKELYKAMVHAEEEKPTTITTFLDDVALMQAQSKAKGDSDAILLMTVHAAKGLEFNNIVIAGLEEGLFPSSRSLLDDNALEEERRLLYVGITRAKERLLLTYSRYRYTYGTMTDCRPSRFLSEIPSSLIQHLDCSYWTTEQLHATLCQWLKGATPAAVESRKKIVKAVEQKKEKIFTTAHKVTWKKNQPVTHTTFGVGVIKDIELKGNQKTYLTVSFKSGIKKVAAEFVTVV